MNCAIVNCVLMYKNVSDIMHIPLCHSSEFQIANTNNMNYTHFRTNSSEMSKKY